MYKEFYGFSKKPFNITPNSEFLYLSPKHKDAITFLEYGLMEDTGFVLLTGEIGMGKTTLIHHMLKRIEANRLVASIDNTNVDSVQLLHMILQEFGLTSQSGNKALILKTLIDYMKDKVAKNLKPLLIIDEAQNLSDEALEEVRLLSNMQWEDKMLLQIILVGQPELKSTIESPRMSSFSQRIAVRFHLPSLTREETKEYIEHRLNKADGDTEIFSEDALEKIYELSRGIPRSINLICNEALVYGFADDLKKIDSSIFDKRDSERGIIELESEEISEEIMPVVHNKYNRIQSADPYYQKLEAYIQTLEKRTDSRLENLEQLASSVQNDVVERIWKLLQMERKRGNKLFGEYNKLRDKHIALQNTLLLYKNQRNKTDTEKNDVTHTM
ncbi:MAG: AAA family ATPase [Desulfobacterales bacterium]|nr:AAA family ATPase [Desulfobacterales bacterium]